MSSLSLLPAAYEVCRSLQFAHLGRCRVLLIRMLKINARVASSAIVGHPRWETGIDDCAPSLPARRWGSSLCHCVDRANGNRSLQRSAGRVRLQALGRHYLDHSNGDGPIRRIIGRRPLRPISLPTTHAVGPYSRSDIHLLLFFDRVVAHLGRTPRSDRVTPELMRLMQNSTDRNGFARVGHE